MLAGKRKPEPMNRFRRLAGERETWIEKNRCDNEDQAGYCQFLASEGFSA